MYILWLLVWDFRRLLCIRPSVSLHLCVVYLMLFVGVLFPLFVVLLICFCLIFALFYCYSLDAYLFSKKTEKGVESHGRGGCGILRDLGKETVIRVYCMKNIYFQLKKERKRKNE